MKRTIRAILALTVMFPVLSSLAFSEGDKSIYGQDDRVDYFAAPSDMKALSDSVVSLWESGNVLGTRGGATFSLQTQNFGAALQLCQGERFREQPMGAFCSGSLVGEDLVMTAGHCITDQARCDDTKIVFGFAVKSNGGSAPTSIAREEVYSCKSIVTRYLAGESGTSQMGPDYALIKLDRKVTGHKPLAINRGAGAGNGSRIVVIGHPVGLPLKVAAGASVRDASPAGYFTSDLDTFGGNSGSPVFNASTKLIEGILVRGDEDFQIRKARFGLSVDAIFAWVKGERCRTMATYAQSGGRGEDVTKISVLKAHIPAIGGRSTVKSGPAIEDISSGDINNRLNLSFE